jgi:predicted metalloprotease
MRWKGGRRSENVEDRRTVSPRGVALGGGGAIILVIVAMLFGADPGKIMQMLQANAPPAQPGQNGQGAAPLNPAEEELKDFVSVVLADTEDVWHEQFRRMGKQYREPTLVLFSGQVESACGRAGASVGPFYCPADQKVYIDLSFYDQLKRRHGAPGDFAQAYVIAHEIGHHVQNLLGTTNYVHSRQGRVSEEEYNDLSVRLELQADSSRAADAANSRRRRCRRSVDGRGGHR